MKTLKERLNWDKLHLESKIILMIPVVLFVILILANIDFLLRS